MGVETNLLACRDLGVQAEVRLIVFSASKWLSNISKNHCSFSRLNCQKRQNIKMSRYK